MSERCPSYSTSREAGCFLNEGHTGAHLYGMRSIYEQPGWQGPMWNGCGGCNFTRRTSERVYCAQCRNEIGASLSCLASNLAIAGALCRAFEIGGDSAMEHHWLGEERMALSERTLKRKRIWVPGCGRPAP